MTIINEQSLDLCSFALGYDLNKVKDDANLQINKYMYIRYW